MEAYVNNCKFSMFYADVAEIVIKIKFNINAPIDIFTAYGVFPIFCFGRPDHTFVSNNVDKL